MILGAGVYGKVTKIKVNDKYFALKESEIPEYPEDLELVMACLRKKL